MAPKKATRTARIEDVIAREIPTQAENAVLRRQVEELTQQLEQLKAAMPTTSANPPPLDQFEQEEEQEEDDHSSSSDDLRMIREQVRRRRGHRPRPPPPPRPEKEVDWSRNLKGDIPEFTGNESPDEVVDWISLVNETFEYRHVPEDQHVGLISIRLRGKAIAWWRREKQTRRNKGKTPISQWTRMEEKLRKHFLPTGYRRELYQRYQNLRQGIRTVDQYTNEFNELLTRNNITDSEEMLVSKYLGGLQPQI